MLKTIKKEKFCYQDTLPEKDMEFSWKKPQIETEIEKIFKFIRFLTFSCSFCQIFDTLARLEISKRSKRREFGVREASVSEWMQFPNGKSDKN